MIGRTIAATLLVSGLLVACAARPASEAMPPSELRGQTLAFAAAHVSSAAHTDITDVGPHFEAKTAFTPNDSASSDFVVVAACANSSDVQSASRIRYGVVAVNDLSVKQVERARDGRYQHDAGCSASWFH